MDRPVERVYTTREKKAKGLKRGLSTFPHPLLLLFISLFKNKIYLLVISNVEKWITFIRQAVCEGLDDFKVHSCRLPARELLDGAVYVVKVKRLETS